MEQDKDGNIWLGSASGAYVIKNQQLIHFDAQNGFTDVSVPDIYCDKDNNVWLATWGGGIFKYEGDGRVVFNQMPGLQGAHMVMGMAGDKDNLLLGTNDSGVIGYDGKTFKNIGLPGANPNARLIQCMYTDKARTIWIGTALGGLWKYESGRFEMVKETEGRIVNAVAGDEHGTIWLGVPLGCYYYEQGIISKLPGINVFVSALLSVGKDTVLLGTQEGVTMVVDKKITTYFKNTELAGASIYCMLNAGNNVMIGTADHGLYVWNKKNGSIKNYDNRQGFCSNTIYSMVMDSAGIIWAGTGRGINRIVFNNDRSACSILNDGESKNLVVEANQNAARIVDGKVWFGTTKGIVIYNTNKASTPAYKPHIIIQSASLIGEGNGAGGMKKYIP